MDEMDKGNKMSLILPTGMFTCITSFSLIYSSLYSFTLIKPCSLNFLTFVKCIFWN